MIYKKLYTAYPVSIYNQNITVSVDKINNVIKSFKKKFVDITPEQVSVKTRTELNIWIQDPMLFYFNQYKFALYCASTLCGVTKDDLTHGFELTKSIMNFHVMYQTKRILEQMQCEVPGDNNFKPNNNPYNKTEYHKLLNEFNISSDFVPELNQPSHGLGYIYGEYHGKMNIEHYYKQRGDHPPIYPATGEKNYWQNVDIKGFDHGDFIFKQDNNGDGFLSTVIEIKQDFFYYQRLIADHKSEVDVGSKFTFPDRGRVRINDSIRAYVYCLLGAQTEVRSDFLGSRSLDAQQKFLELVNDLINKKQSIEESIDNFQDALSKTKGVINYVIGKGLYEIPSDLNLNKLQKSVSGFNTDLITAGNLSNLGVYNAVSKKNIQGNSTTQTHSPIKLPETQSDYEANRVHERVKRDEHEGSKVLIGGLIVAGGIIYISFKK